jgi:hypothetical protein
MPVDRSTLTPRTDLGEPLPGYNTNPNAGPDAEAETDTGADETSDPVEEEISELNHHTNGIEFHGSTSSVAFLGHLQKARDPQRTQDWPAAHTHAHAQSRVRPQEYSIVSTLHNAGFSPTNTAAQAQQSLSLAAVHEHNYYFDHAHVFMSGYFENIHFVHPFIDKEDFYLRAQDLWLRRTPTPDPSFVALYLSVLSFGALLRVWDEGQLGGLTRFEWSRKLFGEAQLYLNHLHFPNNLDAVQCLYLMVCSLLLRCLGWADNRRPRFVRMNSTRTVRPAFLLVSYSSNSTQWHTCTSASQFAPVWPQASIAESATLIRAQIGSRGHGGKFAPIQSTSSY